MSFCSQCGTWSDPADGFCGQCGKATAAPRPAELEAPQIPDAAIDRQTLPQEHVIPSTSDAMVLRPQEVPDSDSIPTATTSTAPIPKGGQHSLLPMGLVARRQVGDLGHPYWLAGSNDGLYIHLEPGEEVLWAGPAQVSQTTQPAWRLPSETAFVVTDRRLAWLGPPDKGSTWIGFGAAGLAIALTATAVSRSRAAKRSRNVVTIGHARYEWVSGMVCRRGENLIGRRNHLLLLVPDSHGSRFIEVSGRSIDEEFAVWLARVISWHRHGIPMEWSAEEESQLVRYEDGSIVDNQHNGVDRHWSFPGTTQTLIAMQSDRYK